MRKTILTAIIVLLSAAAWAGPRRVSVLKASAREAINVERAKKQLPPLSGEPQELHRASALTVYGFEGEGFAVVANDDRMPEVLGISDGAFRGTANESFAWWLRAINEACENAQTSTDGPRRVTKPDPDVFPESVEPMVSAVWGQEAPFWNLCPGTSYNRCVTGCVATAIAQVFYTNRYPTTGVGSRTIYYNSQPVTADFGDTVYEYDKMIDDYRGDYTQEQADAVALLMKDCGVAVNMSYSPDGSGAYSEDAAEGIREYFGVATAHLVERDNFSEAQWMEMVYTELSGGHPMYYSAVDPNPWTGGGHAFVCDGYDEDGRVHINWGWNGTDNGYYNIALLNPPGNQFSQYQDMILGMYDPDDVQIGMELVSLDLETYDGGQLRQLIGEENLPLVKSIAVSGPLDADDIALLRDLASATEFTGSEGETIKSHLSTIDLSRAELEDDEIADRSFEGAVLLRKMDLPRKLSRIGNYAFAGCSRLSNIRSHTYAVPKMGTRVFENVVGGNMSVFVIAGSSDYYRRNAQWKTIITTNNVFEFGTTLKAKNVTRYVGEPNPVFGYTMLGDRVIGSPNLWTDATADSEAGTYVINIEAGTIEETDDVAFVPGTLTVKKAVATGVDALEAATDAAAYTLGGAKAAENARGVVIKKGKKTIR